MTWPDDHYYLEVGVADLETSKALVTESSRPDQALARLSTHVSKRALLCVRVPHGQDPREHMGPGWLQRLAAGEVWGQATNGWGLDPELAGDVADRMAHAKWVEGPRPSAADKAALQAVLKGQGKPEGVGDGL